MTLQVWSKREQIKGSEWWEAGVRYNHDGVTGVLHALTVLAPSKQEALQRLMAKLNSLLLEAQDVAKEGE